MRHSRLFLLAGTCLLGCQAQLAIGGAGDDGGTANHPPVVDPGASPDSGGTVFDFDASARIQDSSYSPQNDAGGIQGIPDSPYSPQDDAGGIQGIPDSPYSPPDDAGSGTRTDAASSPYGIPIQLAEVESPASIVVDNANVYVASYETGPVYEIPLDGGAPITLDAISASTIAINSTQVFTVSPSGEDVVSCAKTGCNGVPTQLASGQQSAWGVAADESNVYWTNQSELADGGSAVMKAPLDGGAPVSLVPTTPDGANAIAVNGDKVFYVASGKTLDVVAASGGAPRVVATAASQSAIDWFAVDSNNAYYTTNYALFQVPLAVDGGAPVTLATFTDGECPVAIDEAYVYWADGSNIRKTSIGGGTVTTLVQGQNGGPFVSGIAVDSTFVYWSDLSNGTVMKIAK